MLVRPSPLSITLLRHHHGSTYLHASAIPHRSFTTTPLHHNTPTPTHYDILRLPPTATAAELKKQFYVLSKETHPDVNKSDPSASQRFAQISESYSVLSNPDKRKKYDRDVMRTHHMSRSHSGHHRHHGGGGSNSSSSGSSYAGSRPASGLSKRRSVFKGPPPSFYAHGGRTNNTTQQNQQQTDHHQQHQAGTFNASAYADPGTWDPAFNAGSVFKTQTHEDYRRATRRAAQMAAMRRESAEDESNFWTRFIVVSGVLVLGVSLASLITAKASSTATKGGLVRADGSRRKRPD